MAGACRTVAPAPRPYIEVRLYHRADPGTALAGTLLQPEEVLPVVPQFGDGFADVVQRSVGVALLEAVQ